MEKKGREFDRFDYLNFVGPRLGKIDAWYKKERFSDAPYCARRDYWAYC